MRTIINGDGFARFVKTLQAYGLMTDSAETLSPRNVQSEISVVCKTRYLHPEQRFEGAEVVAHAC